MVSGVVAVAASAAVVAATLGTGNAGGGDSGAPAPAHRPPPAFQHPGVITGAAELDAARTRIRAGRQPWRNAYTALRGSEFAALTWRPRAQGVVACGVPGSADRGCAAERRDATAAYVHALSWYLSRDERHARKAMAIMDAWSARLREHTGARAPLQAARAGMDFVRAAELIKHGHGRWAGQQRFADTLRRLYLPLVDRPYPQVNGNVELTTLNAASAIAVHLDDRAAFDRAVGLWRKRLPQYVYLRSDGPAPQAPAAVAAARFWHNPARLADGLTQETCRSLEYAGQGLAAALDVAATARLQGVDLYGEARPRLTAALELHARNPARLCRGGSKGSLGPVLEVGHDSYRRLGVKLPFTGRAVAGRQAAGGWEVLSRTASP
ncbi:alginate lyase family protein [Actinomadura kijaniata]